jgi:hypothetical protein
MDRMPNYTYTIGPWKWSASNAHYAPPSGAVGALDFGTLPEQSVGGSDRGRGLFWFPAGHDPGSEYVALATGDCREINSDSVLVSKFQTELGIAVAGERLVDLIFDGFIGGSDPTGDDAVKPLVPTMSGNLELWMPGHSRVKAERFAWGVHRQTDKLKSMLRKEFDGLMIAAGKGELKDDKQHLRVLDAFCDKYRVADWKEFVSSKSQKNVPGRVKHETTITESFNTADSGTLGPTLTWTEVLGTWDVVSNRAQFASGQGISGSARADSDLSSADHYAACDITSLGTANQNGQVRALARFNASAATYYSSGPQYNNGSGGTARHYTVKVVSGTATILAGPTSFTLPSLPLGVRAECNGSTISGHRGGSQIHSFTDTSITGNLRCGIGAVTGASAVNLDDFAAADLSASGNRRRRLIMGAAT